MRLHPQGGGRPGGPPRCKPSRLVHFPGLPAGSAGLCELRPTRLASPAARTPRTRQLPRQTADPNWRRCDYSTEIPQTRAFRRTPRPPTPAPGKPGTTTTPNRHASAPTSPPSHSGTGSALWSLAAVELLNADPSSIDLGLAPGRRPPVVVTGRAFRQHARYSERLTSMWFHDPGTRRSTRSE